MDVPDGNTTQPEMQSVVGETETRYLLESAGDRKNEREAPDKLDSTKKLNKVDVPKADVEISSTRSGENNGKSSTDIPRNEDNKTPEMTSSHTNEKRPLHQMSMEEPPLSMEDNASESLLPECHGDQSDRLPPLKSSVREKLNRGPPAPTGAEGTVLLSAGVSDHDLGCDLSVTPDPSMTPDPSVTPDPEEGQSLAKLAKNVGVLCSAFLLLFTAFMSLSGLLTSVYPDEGVGAGSLAIICGVMIPSSLFLPPALIAKLGCKWTLVLSVSGYVIFMAANFHATWWLMAPASAILGLVAPCLWSAKSIYLTEVGVRWAKMTRSSPAAVIARFFGIFFMMFQSSIIWGNLVSSQVFKPSRRNEAWDNVTSDVSSDVSYDVNPDLCGAAFCPLTSLNQTALVPPEAWQIYALCGAFLAFTLLAGVLLALLLDPLTPRRHDVKHTSHLHRLILTSRHLLRNRTQQLLIPLTVYNGIQQAFLYGDLTQSYAGCALGVWKIGYVMICLGVADALTSVLAGRLVQYTGNVPVLTAGGIIHLGVLLTLLLWRPDPRAEHIVFIVSALYGMGDAIIQTNSNAVYGTVFADSSEPAFANFHVWESVGTLIPFVYSKLLCTDVKIYVSIASLVLGMLGYYGAELHHRSAASIIRKEEQKTSVTLTVEKEL